MTRSTYIYLDHTVSVEDIQARLIYSGISITREPVTGIYVARQPTRSVTLDTPLRRANEALTHD